MIRDAVGTDLNFDKGLTHTASLATRLATKIRIAVASLATQRLIKPVAKRCWEPRVSKTPQKDLVDSTLSWFKVLPATSMNQKFPYILRISEKAKHVRFQVSVEKGLEIVVPKRFSASRVPSLVEKNSQWIERAFRRAKAFQELIGPVAGWQMPEEIRSLALDLTWRVLTRRDDMKSVVVRETLATTLVLHGATDDAAACQKALKGWLTNKAQDHLIPWLKRVSDETGLSYSAVSIRQQKTRWGSCSSRRLISLNARLLFLPPELVTYVLVHELCHTKHLNHSPRFWRLVESYLPDYRQFDRQLRNAGRCMPGWLTASCGGKAGKLGIGKQAN
jgi:predicted metal-dependent hydrolase